MMIDEPNGGSQRIRCVLNHIAKTRFALAQLAFAIQPLTNVYERDDNPTGPQFDRSIRCDTRRQSANEARSGHRQALCPPTIA